MREEIILEVGQIQAIGGVNEKIEGFFDICRLRGLTEFAADVTADYVVALLLEIVADILAFEPEDIEAS